MDEMEKIYPQSRVSDVVMKEMPNEVLLYDLARHKAHCLNHTAALIWKYCDGATSVAIITQRLAQSLHRSIKEEVVWLALEQLSHADLLETKLRMPAALRVQPRRRMLRQLAALSVLVPTVTSIIAPTAQAANSCVGQPCSSDAQCACSDCCNTVIGQCVVTGLADDAHCSVDCQCMSGNCAGSPKVCIATEI